jgi:hypothetical protein
MVTASLAPQGMGIGFELRVGHLDLSGFGTLYRIDLGTSTRRYPGTSFRLTTHRYATSFLYYDNQPLCTTLACPLGDTWKPRGSCYFPAFPHPHCATARPRNVPRLRLISVWLCQTSICDATNFLRQAATSKMMSAIRIPSATAQRDCQTPDLIGFRAIPGA